MEIFFNPVCWILLSIFVSFIITVYYFLKGQALNRHGARVKGTVTDSWTEDHDSGADDMSTRTFYYLKGYFTDEKDDEHSFKLVVPGSVYSIGYKTRAVYLIHPPGNPEKAKLDNKNTVYNNAIWWAVILLTLIGTYFSYLYWS